MGSGHFPSEGFSRASYFHNLKSINEDLMYRDPENLVKYVRRPECYDLQLNVDPPNLSGFHFYYGALDFQLSV
ncbi:hypothetical protein NL676_034934 [Syzygium grande]|nr:hypothetical protein NL676_034934 [Syzygium grande]